MECVLGLLEDGNSCSDSVIMINPIREDLDRCWELDAADIPYEGNNFPIFGGGASVVGGHKLKPPDHPDMELLIFQADHGGWLLC